MRTKPRIKFQAEDDVDKMLQVVEAQGYGARTRFINEALRMNCDAALTTILEKRLATKALKSRR